MQCFELLSFVSHPGAYWWWCVDCVLGNLYFTLKGHPFFTHTFAREVRIALEVQIVYALQAFFHMHKISGFKLHA